MVLTSPWVMLRKRPITVLMMLLTGMSMLWLGYILIHLHLTVAQSFAFTGPMTFAGLHTWGWAFITGGGVTLLRIPLLDMQLVSLFLHLPVMTVALAWSVSFDVGPPTTGQAVYTFFAAIVALSPFLTSIIIYFAKATGYAFMATPKAKYSTSEWMKYNRDPEAVAMADAAFDATQAAKGSGRRHDA